MEAWRKQIGLRRIAPLVALVTVAFASPAGTIEGSPEASTVRLVPRDLRDGDIVFRRGNDALAAIALSYGDRPRFSHVGVIVRAGDALDVIHAIPVGLESLGGVRRDPLDRFIDAGVASDVAYYRLDVLSPDQRGRIQRYLTEAIGGPFDYQFKYSDDSAFYCSELVVKALHASGVDIRPELATVDGVMLGEPAIPPDTIRHSQQLRELMADVEMATLDR